MVAVARAQRSVRKSRSSCWVANGRDNYDHKSLKKARRRLDRALIEEALEPEPQEHFDDLELIYEYEYSLGFFDDPDDGPAVDWSPIADAADRVQVAFTRQATSLLQAYEACKRYVESVERHAADILEAQSHDHAFNARLNAYNGE